MITPSDQLRALIDVVIDSLDDEVDGAALAARAHFSRFHFDRLVRAAIGETPVAFRRRLLLERAAWQLRDTGASVTETALNAGYGSSEAFSRAFAAAFGAPPSAWALRAWPDFRLPAPSRVHFHPPAGLLLGDHDGKASAMDLVDRMIEHDLSVTRALLASADDLEADALDSPARPGNEVLSFDGPETSAREMLERLVFTKEVWTAAIAGRDFPAHEDCSVDGLRRRLDAAGEEFADLVRRIRDRGEWDAAFVDALCDPPESFSFGGVVAHVLTFSAHRRQMVRDVLAELGATDLPSTDPNLWERSSS